MSVVNLLASKDRHVQEIGILILSNLSNLEETLSIMLPALPQVFFFS